MFYKNTSVYTATINSAVYAYEVRRTLFKKTFSVFPYSYRNTSGSLGEIKVGTRASTEGEQCFHTISTKLL